MGGRLQTLSGRAAREALNWVRSLILTRAINIRHSTRMNLGKQITELFSRALALGRVAQTSF